MLGNRGRRRYVSPCTHTTLVIGAQTGDALGRLFASTPSHACAYLYLFLANALTRRSLGHTWCSRDELLFGKCGGQKMKLNAVLLNFHGHAMNGHAMKPRPVSE